MPDIDVKAYIDQLRERLPYVPPIPVQKIKALHRKGDLGGVVKLIRGTMNVGVRLTVHWTSGPPPKEIPNAPAWIALPEKMPYYGTSAFNELSLDIFIMKSFAETKPYDQFAMAVAHELSHVVLESLEHPLRKKEKAVDLTAMILGFSYIYRQAAHTVEQVGYSTFRRNQIGYLSEPELDAACKVLLPASVRTRHAALNYARASAGLLVVLGIGLAAWGVPTLSNAWQLHQAVVAQQKAIEKQIPLRFGQFRTLIGVRAGLTTLTRVFQLEVPPEDPMTSDQLADFQIVVKKDICSTEGRNIRKGIAYVNEYWGTRGNFIARLEFSSCP